MFQKILNETWIKLKSGISDVLNTNHKLVDNVLNYSYNPTPKSQLFPYTYYDPENQLFYCDDGSFGFGMLARPIVGCDLNTYKQISLLISDQLPFGGLLQTLLLASDDLDGVLQNWQNARTTKDPIYRKLEQYKRIYYKDYNQDSRNHFKHRNYKLFFFFSVAKGDLVEVLKFREHLKSILETIKIRPRYVAAQDFLSLMFEMINYPDFKDITYNEHDLLSQQLTDLSSRLLVEESGLKNGEYTSRLYQADVLPEKFSIGEMTNLLGDSKSANMQIPARFLLSYTIVNNIGNQEALRSKGSLIIKQAKGVLALFNSTLKEEGLEWEKIEEQLKKREKFMTSAFLVMISAKSELISKAEQSLLSLWRKNDIHLKSTKYFHLPALLSICPFVASAGLLPLMKHFNLSRTVLSSEARALLPLNGEWAGSQNGGMLMSGKKGQLFAWDSFEGGSNYNVCVIGESGSGKSVFLQEFVLSHLAKGARVFVIDIGRSFEKTCKILGGDFIDFNSGSQISLNPFVSIPVEDSPITQDSLNLLKFTVSKMVAPKGNTKDIQDSIISSAIFDTWAKYKQSSTFDHLAEELGKSGERGQDLKLMLFEYTSKGSYGKFFSSADNITFTKDLTVLEFESLRERPDLGSVIMQMISIQIVQQIYLGDRKRRFIILFDEAWYALLGFPKLLASMARTLRKYNGALVLGTQSITDFYPADTNATEEDVARASILENSTWRVLLKQKADSAEKASKIGLKQAQINLVKNLEVVKGQYSESLIFQSENDYFVSRLMLDRFASVLLSSSPETFNRVNDLISQGVAVDLAVEKVMEEIYGN